MRLPPVIGCALVLIASSGSAVRAGEAKMEPLHVTSGAFAEGAAIPKVHTCDDRDVSPALSWSKGPVGTKSFALLCEDPDAPRGMWVHWVLWGIPADTLALEQGIAKRPALPGGAAQGKNDFGEIGYGGPCPPPGKPHRYVFKVYALDAAPKLAAGATRADLLKAIEGHVLAEGALMGTYKR